MRQAMRSSPTPTVKVSPESVRAPFSGSLVNCRTCPICQKPLSDRQRVCSGKCRAARRHQKKAEERVDRDRELRWHLEAALRLLGKPENTT